MRANTRVKIKSECSIGATGDRIMNSQPAVVFECLEAVASAILVVREGQIVWANNAAAALTAYDSASLVGMALRNLIAPEWQSHVPFGGELEIVTATGELTRVNLALRPADVAGHRVEIATVTEVDAPPAADPDARASIIRSIIDSSLDGFYILKAIYDQAGRLTDFVFEDVNRRAETITRLKREQIVGRSLRSLYPGNVGDYFFNLHSRVLQSGQPIEEDYETSLPDRADRWLRHQVIPLGQRVAVFARDITERKQFESALRESERGFQALLNQSNDCVSLLDTEGNYLLVNTQLATSLGYSVDEMIGMNVSDVIAPGEVADYREINRIVQEGRRIPYFERTYRRKDGSEFLGEVNVSLVRGADGTPKYVQSIMRDITWRKTAEQALRESEERYRIISELISDYAYSFRVEPDGTLVSEWITDSFYRMTGYAPEEIDAQGQFALYHPDDAARAAADVGRVVAGEAGSAEYRVITKSGEVRWVAIDRKPVWDAAQRRVVHLYGVAQDITERKQSEERLRRSEEQYRLIAENATDMITRTDTNDARIYVSSASRALLGYEPEELVGPHSPPLLHPDDIAVMERAWRSSEISTTSVTFVCRMRHKSGEYSWFEVTGKTIMDAETGAIKEYLALSRDISSRVEMETMLKEQERLRFALQKEQELNDVKSNLMRTISHEFRTPLALILTSTDFLDAYLDRLDPPRRQERLQAIRLQVKRLSDMLDDISFVVQGTLHHMAAHASPMNLERYCRDIVDEIAVSIGRHHQFSFLSDGQLVEGTADKALVMRILTNLLSNAVKYSPEGSTITVRLQRVGDDAVLEISDQGIGIAPEDQKRIFEPFYRGTSVIDSVGGTGLGLSIVKDCVDLHGGTITVASAVNSGTTFTIRLPQHPA